MEGKNHKLLITILCIALVLSLSMNGFMVYKVGVLSSRCEELKKDYEKMDELRQKATAAYIEQKVKADNLSSVIVAISISTPYYHTYECENWNRNDFRFANVGTAIKAGLKPCPECNPPQ